MERPNWFDGVYGDTAKGTAQQILQKVAGDKRLIAELDKALAAHDQSCKTPGWAGPSRVQVVRNTPATTLNAS